MRGNFHPASDIFEFCKIGTPASWDPPSGRPRGTGNQPAPVRNCGGPVTNHSLLVFSRHAEMSEVSRLLTAVANGDRHAAAALLPLVYDELRGLAAQRMNLEAPGHTLQPTALVHEAYLRLVGNQTFENRGHFFAAAAEAMRRILIDYARRKKRSKNGGTHQRRELPDDLAVPTDREDELLALDQALSRLAEADPEKARLVELRYFGGLTGDQAAEVLGISASTADRHWVFARAWLRRELAGGDLQ